MNGSGGNGDATRGAGSWTNSEQERYWTSSYGAFWVRDTWSCNLFYSNAYQFDSIPGTARPFDVGAINAEAYLHPPPSTFRYPSPSHQTTNATPYYHPQQDPLQSQYENDHSSNADAARSSSRPLYNIRESNSSYRAMPSVSGPYDRSVQQARARAYWQSQQELNTLLSQPRPSGQPPRSPSWAEIAAANPAPAFVPNPLQGRAMTNMGRPNIATGRHQPQQATRPLPNGTRNIDMRRETPPAYTPPAILALGTNANVGPWCDFPLFEDCVMDWLQEPMAIGERTGLVANTSATRAPLQNVRSPT